MVSELAGEGAVPPQLPAPASHAELRICLRQSIRRGSLVSRQYVNQLLDSELDFFVDVGNKLAYATGKVICNLSAVLFKSNQSSVSDDSWSRSMKNTSKVLVNVLFAGFNRNSWSRSAECSSRVLVNLLIAVFNRISRSRFVKVLSRVLISHLFTAFNPCSRRRSTEISSRVLVNPIVSVFDRNSGSSESSSAELVDPSPVAIPGADPWKARAMCSLIINDSWSRSMDSWSRVTVAVSSPQRRTSKEKQQVPSQSKTAGDDGGALSKLSPTLKSSVSDSSDSLLLMSGTEDRAVAPLLVFFMLVTKPPKFGGSFKKIEGSRKVEHSNLKKVDNASEVDCIRTLEVFSLSILIWKWIIKLWHFQDLRKRIAEMSFAKREYEFLREVGIGPRNFGCYVNSVWRASGPTVYTVNPSNNQAIADVVEASICDYEERKRACYEAAKLWMQIPAPKRGEIVKQIGDVLRAKVYHLGYFVSLEMGKILPERIGEVLEIIDMCDFAVGLSHMMLEKNNLPGAIFHHWSSYSHGYTNPSSAIHWDLKGEQKNDDLLADVFFFIAVMSKSMNLVSSLGCHLTNQGLERGRSPISLPVSHIPDNVLQEKVVNK